MRIDNNIIKGCGIECGAVPVIINNEECRDEMDIVTCGEVRRKMNDDEFLFLCVDCLKRLKKDLEEKK